MVESGAASRKKTSREARSRARRKIDQIGFSGFPRSSKTGFLEQVLPGAGQIEVG